MYDLTASCCTVHCKSLRLWLQFKEFIAYERHGIFHYLLSNNVQLSTAVLVAIALPKNIKFNVVCSSPRVSERLGGIFGGT